MSAARHLAYAELSFLCGVAAASAGIFLLTPFLAACIAVMAYWRRPLLPLVLLGACALLGLLRFAQTSPSEIADTLHQLAGREATLAGFVVQEPDRRLDEQRLTVRVTRMHGSEAVVHGNTLAVVELYPRYDYGDGVQLRCRLERPEAIEDFAYDEYLALSKVFTLCRFARATPTGEVHGSPVLRALLKGKHALLQRVEDRLAEPQSSLLAGVLLGARQGMSDAIQEDFRRAGLSHLVALSGYNISVLAAAVMAVMLKAHVSRPAAFWVVTVALVVFVLVTGASPSVVRASVMGFLVVLARRSGRSRNIWYALLFAAAVMVAINPRVLAFDVGFQLSFLATLGLLLVGSPIASRLVLLPERFGLRDALASTLAATLATLPLLAVQFGRLSLVSPVVNLLVLPLMPMIMLMGSLTLLPFIGTLASVIAWLGLTWVLICAQFFAGLSGSTLSVVLPQELGLLAYGGAVIIVLWIKLQRRRSVNALDVADSSS